MVLVLVSLDHSKGSAFEGKDKQEAPGKWF